MVLPTGGSGGGGSTYAIAAPGSGYDSTSLPPPPDDHGAHRGTALTGHNADGSGVNDLNGLINPPLNPLADVNYYGFDGVPLNKGYIVRVAKEVTDSPKSIPISKRQRFRFLYNPAELTFTNAVFTGLVDPSSRNPAESWHGRFTGQESVTFQLMLDRTQEAYIYGSHTRGTLVDIDALYKVVNGNDDPLTPNGNPGFMYLSEVAIVFGGIDTGGRTTLPVYPCFITSLTIDHTQFTPRMVPIRTIVSVSATRLTTQAATAAIDPKLDPSSSPGPARPPAHHATVGPGSNGGAATRPSGPT